MKEFYFAILTRLMDFTRGSGIISQPLLKLGRQRQLRAHPAGAPFATEQNRNDTTTTTAPDEVLKQVGYAVRGQTATGRFFP